MLQQQAGPLHAVCCRLGVLGFAALVVRLRCLQLCLPGGAPDMDPPPPGYLRAIVRQLAGNELQMTRLCLQWSPWQQLEGHERLTFIHWHVRCLTLLAHAGGLL